jgi:hypothetical protein
VAAYCSGCVLENFMDSLSTSKKPVTNGYNINRILSQMLVVNSSKAGKETSPQLCGGWEQEAT